MTNFTWKTIFKYRNLIYGLVAIWIVLYHIHQKYWLGIPLISPIINMGNMGVDVFLLLSAVGLSYSIEKNDIKTFYKNRLKRTFLTYLLIAGPFIVWKYFISQAITPMTVPNFALELSTLSYFWTKEGVFPVWYIPCILLFYALYPALYKLYRKNKFYIVGLILVAIILELFLLEIKSPIIKVTERTFSRIPIFLAGILISDCVKKEKKIAIPWVLLSFSVVIYTMVLFPINNLYKYGANTVHIRYCYGVMAIALLIAGAYFMELVNKFKVTNIFVKAFSFLGAISLEIYLVHIVIMRLLTHYGLQHQTHWSVYYAGVTAAGIIIGLGFNKLLNFIVSPKGIKQKK